MLKLFGAKDPEMQCHKKGDTFAVPQGHNKKNFAELLLLLLRYQQARLNDFYKLLDHNYVATFFSHPCVIYP